MKSHERRKPCGNCPFRKEAPLAYWHPTMYQMLADIEQREHEFGRASVFGCHKDRQGPSETQEYCVGWLLNQRERGVPNLALRIGLMIGDDSEAATEQFNECEPDGEMYETVAELVESNLDRDRVLHPERYEEGF